MALSKARDRVRTVGSSDVATAVVKATSHTAREVPKEKHIQSTFSIFFMASSLIVQLRRSPSLILLSLFFAELLIASSGGKSTEVLAALRKRFEDVDWKVCYSFDK
jgi:hypothetical protein